MRAALVTNAGSRNDALNEAPAPRVMKLDYHWAVRMGLIAHSEEAWAEWAEGYATGEEIAVRVQRAQMHRDEPRRRRRVAQRVLGGRR
jgi:hypothetical protein